MSKYRLVGIQSIVFGSVLNTTTWSNTGTLRVLNLVPSTAKMAIAVPTKSKYYVEDSDYPDVVLAEAGDQIVEFSTRDMHNSFMKLAFGGTTNGTLTYLAPTEPVGVVEKSIQLISKPISGQKFTFTIPRAEVSAGAELRFSNKGAGEPGGLSFSCNILQGANGATLLPPWKCVRSA
jgi:hypothetical protein